VLSMSAKEREAFLAGLHVGVISIVEPGRGPLTVPIWYAYEPGGDLRVVVDVELADYVRLDLSRQRTHAFFKDLTLVRHRNLGAFCGQSLRD